MRTMVRQKIRGRVQKQPDLMKRFLVAGICGMAGFIGSTGLASAQTAGNLTNTSNTSGQAQKAPDQFQVQVYAPSDLAISPSGAKADHPSRKRHGLSMNATAASRPAPAHNGGNITGLCFQPGIGWTAVSVAANDRGLGQRNVERKAGVSSEATDHRQVGQAVSAGSNECSTVSQSQDAAAAGVSDQNYVSEYNNGQLSPDSNLSSYDGLANSDPSHSFPYDSGSGNGSSRLGLPDVRQGRAVHDAADPSAALDELKALQHRAYISPMKLRRLARDVQDLQTRLELRQMNAAVGKRAPSSTSEDERTPTGGASATGRKNAGRGPFATTECGRKSDASKSKACAQAKR